MVRDGAYMPPEVEWSYAVENGEVLCKLRLGQEADQAALVAMAI